jgi:hypothetical protein
MAASAWEFYNSFKEYMADGTLDLDDNVFRLTLHTSAANVDDNTLTVLGSATGELADGNGYSTSGKTLSATTWGPSGVSASEMRFDSTAVVWTATGGNLTNVRFAVIHVSGASAGALKLVARAALSTAQFNVTTGNTLTVTPSANGIFELN